ncbi:MAG: DsrE family protein [Chitinophagaceae bacterium]
MKKIILLAVILLLIENQMFSQSNPYNIIFDVTSGDTAVHHRVTRWITGIINSNPNAKVEVVFYGKSLTMIETETSTRSTEIKKLAESKNVIFAVCEQAMKVHNVTKSQLLAGVTTVPDALYELISKQHDGYGYIKVVN